MESFTEIQLFLFIFTLSAVADLVLAISKGEDFHPAKVLGQRLARAFVSGLAAIAVWSFLSEFSSPKNQLAIGVSGGTVLVGVETISTMIKIFFKEKLGLKGGDK